MDMSRTVALSSPLTRVEVLLWVTSSPPVRERKSPSLLGDSLRRSRISYEEADASNARSNLGHPIEDSPEPILLVVVRREGTKKTQNVENIAVRMENKVEVSDAQPSAFENV